MSPLSYAARRVPRGAPLLALFASVVAALGCGNPLADSCEIGDDAVIPRLSLRGPSPFMPVSYDGPAVVERSTAKDMLLAYAIPVSPADPPAAHTTISGLAPIPILPLGARVWLTRTGDSDATSGFGAEITPWAMTVRDRQHGHVLFGAVQVPHELATAPLPGGAPVALGDVRPICSRATPDSCSGAEVTYLRVDVLGDTKVAIAHGAVSPVLLDGVTYDVAVRGWYVTGKVTADFCSDLGLQSSLEVTVVAHDLDALVAGLDVGEPLACSEGNAPEPRFVYFTLLKVPTSTAYTGPAIFRGPAAGYPDGLAFDVPELASSFGMPQLVIERVASLIRPSVGATYWVSMPRGSSWSPMLLRESEEGLPVIASIRLAGAELASAPPALEEMLGATITGEPRCLYSEGTGGATPLYDLVLGTDPPTRILAGQSGTLTIAGRPFTVEVRGIGMLDLLVYPRH